MLIPNPPLNMPRQWEKTKDRNDKEIERESLVGARYLPRKYDVPKETTKTPLSHTTIMIILPTDSGLQVRSFLYEWRSFLFSKSNNSILIDQISGDFSYLFLSEARNFMTPSRLVPSLSSPSPTNRNPGMPCASYLTPITSC
ncbi:hypothetical protein M413DRAFT_144412 [Hebeloma cylindrosporum]|uniref:Uncharacterized protein n=1 Tax=Hebeloma cylindrosporum TaxID=76867 RepID=A0A0C2XU91_HEBCY|nr:hypothetical protein M413DRAFT_144412 [Hebeloma cylindrosporum h7]